MTHNIKFGTLMNSWFQSLYIFKGNTWTKEILLINIFDKILYIRSTFFSLCLAQKSWVSTWSGSFSLTDIYLLITYLISQNTLTPTDTQIHPYVKRLVQENAVHNHATSLIFSKSVNKYAL